MCDFWTSLTIDQLAEMQDVQPVRSLDDVLGGWPDDEIEDGFEDALAQWRLND